MIDNSRKSNILLVEDNPGDARLAREVMRESNAGISLHVVEDGVEAISFLRHIGRYAEMPRPDLVLLDLNLPRMDGRQVLAEMKSDARLRRIPVIMLTTSQAEEDIHAAYNLHANCYINKPPELDQFIAVLRGVEQFWFSIVRLSAD